MSSGPELDPMPAALALPAGYERHTPTREGLRSAVAGLVAAQDWASLSWSELMDGLLALGRTDVPLGRLVEGHVDAVRTCAQAGGTLVPDALYGIWASRSGATGVRARVEGGSLVLDGTLRFASGAGLIDRSLVPVWTSDEHHLLVDVDVSGLPVDGSGWQTRAMAVSQSHTVQLTAVSVPLSAVLGAEDFYLDRPGFFPGGVGVAAVWAGAISRIIDGLLAWLGERQSPAVDLRLGRLSTQRDLATATVRQAGRRLDVVLVPGEPAPSKAQLYELSTAVRAGVASCVHAALAEARLLAGPVGLAFDAALTHAIDDLGLYVLQQNTDADAAYLGAQLRR